MRMGSAAAPGRKFIPDRTSHQSVLVGGKPAVLHQHTLDSLESARYFQWRFRKLVRDLIPQVIAASGKTCLVEVLDQDAYLRELNRKLAEELAEYQASQDLAELADLVEVTLALIKTKGPTLSEFEALRQAKALDRGTFDRRLFLVQVDDA